MVWVLFIVELVSEKSRLEILTETVPIVTQHNAAILIFVREPVNITRRNLMHLLISKIHIIDINNSAPALPYPSLAYFELADLVSVLLTSSGQAVVVCGDLNCHGDDPYSTDKLLAAVFDLLNMKQHVHSPTRDNRLLDILACSDDQLIHDVIVDDAGNMTDHRLIKAVSRFKAMDASHIKISTSVKNGFRLFFNRVCSRHLCSLIQKIPFDSFADQLRNVVTSTLDKLAQLQTVDRISGGNHINQFLSQKAYHAKLY